MGLSLCQGEIFLYFSSSGVILIQMEIRNLGWKSFRIRAGNASIITYPFSQKDTGVSFPKTTAEVVISNGDVDDSTMARISSKTRSSPFVIAGPGEYEVSEIEVLGFPSGYWFKMNGLVLVFLDNVDKKRIAKLSDDFQGIDIIFLGSDNSELSKEILGKISPPILIPYCSSQVDKKELLSFSWAKKILDILDLENSSPLDVLKVEKQGLFEETQVHLLKPKI